jgi:glucosamine-6-phosphate deaminase
MKSKSSLPVNSLSSVEAVAVERSGQNLIYPPEEKIGVVVASNFPGLGRITALRFLEWVQKNPDGVVSLPTGKTPEHFIKFTQRCLKNWDSSAVRSELEENGLDPAKRPDLRRLRFVQIDEFYPMDPTHQNSFYYYVENYYIRGFGFNPSNALLIDGSRIGIPQGMTLNEVWPDGDVDLSLRFRHPATHLEHIQRSVLEQVDQWCQEYEEKIRSMGGIGFFLGGIGPDGHIAFNVRGTDHHSTTHLGPTNYETQAASASDLGGIEVARKRLALTIGLATITHNADGVAIIMAAGESKSKIVRDAVMNDPHVITPGTALHKLPNARFFITSGAAVQLTERVHERLMNKEAISDEDADRIVIRLSETSRKPVLDLNPKVFEEDRFGRILLRKSGKTGEAMAREVHDRLLARISDGADARTSTRFLHTAPHHDDIELGYFASVVRNIRDASNRHTFTYLTSGFTAVTNQYALSLVENLRSFLKTAQFTRLFHEGYFDPKNLEGRNRDMWQYLDGVASLNQHTKREGEARRLLRNLIELFEEDNPRNLENRIDELINYFETQYPGKKDMPHIQRMKGMIREWEADCMWGYLGFSNEAVVHLRLGFYKGDLFSDDPMLERDIPPVLRLLERLSPNIVTVALDPEGSGPDTHYKVLQIMAEALKQHEAKSQRSDIEIWGYRNVWYRFHPAEANSYVPVSLNMFSTLDSAFKNAFVSQKDASFPSHEHDGPFSSLVQRIQVEQYHTLKRCLGRQFFYNHPRPLIRATRGFTFLKKMSLQEFYATARELKKTTESDS